MRPTAPDDWSSPPASPDRPGPASQTCSPRAHPRINLAVLALHREANNRPLRHAAGDWLICAVPGAKCACPPSEAALMPSPTSAGVCVGPIIKFPSTFAGGTAPSGSSLASTNPAECGSCRRRRPLRQGHRLTHPSQKADQQCAEESGIHNHSLTWLTAPFPSPRRGGARGGVMQRIW